MAKRLPDGSLAQLVERFVYTEDVGGSSPSRPTMIPNLRFCVLRCRARHVAGLGMGRRGDPGDAAPWVSWSENR